MTLRVGRARVVGGEVEVRWLAGPCGVFVAGGVTPEVRPLAFPPCECRGERCPDRPGVNGEGERAS